MTTCKAFGTRSVYTPQAVINGRVHVNGAKREAVDGALDELENAGKGTAGRHQGHASRRQRHDRGRQRRRPRQARRMSCSSISTR